MNGLPHIHHPDQLCEACIFGKNHRIPFVKEPWCAKFPLEFVHTNVCGPMNISSIGGNKYFLTFIDDFSRKTRLDDKVEKTIFIGYKHGGYKL